KIAIELAIDRRAEPRRHALGDHLDHGTDRGAALADLVDIAFEELGFLGIGREERIAVDLVPIPARAVDLLGSHLDERAAPGHAGHDLARDRAGGDPHRGLARRLPATAAIVANAILDVIGVVGVAGPILVLDVGI